MKDLQPKFSGSYINVYGISENRRRREHMVKDFHFYIHLIDRDRAKHRPSDKQTHRHTLTQIETDTDRYTPTHKKTGDTHKAIQSYTDRNNTQTK